jgi:type II secretory pathway pseudopilin PulG
VLEVVVVAAIVSAVTVTAVVALQAATTVVEFLKRATDYNC